MSDYKRTSQICTYTELPAILQLALHQEAEDHHCGQIPEDIMICIQTISQHKEAGILTRFKNRLTGLPKPGSIQHSAAIIVPGWLIWAFTNWNSDSKATALSVRLNEAEITDYAHNDLIEDYGLNIIGVSSGSLERSLMFLGLGQSRDAEQFKQFLQQAAQQSIT